MSSRLPVMFLAALATACIESNPSQIEGDDGGETRGDAGDLGLDPPDAPLPDARPRDAAPEPTDRVPVPDAAAPPDAAPEPPDGAPPGRVPAFGQVAVTTARERTWVAWVSEVGLVSRPFGPDHAWTDRAQVIDPNGESTALAAATVNGVPVVAWSANGGRTVGLARADRPGDGAIGLDLGGSPVLAAQGSRLLVFGQVEGDFAWQSVGFADPDRPVAGERRTFPGLGDAPDSAGVHQGAVAVRFGATGQCLSFGEDGEPAGTFVCAPGEAGFISSDGAAAALVTSGGRRGVQQLRVTALLGGSAFEPYTLGEEAPETLASPFPAADGTRPLLVRPEGADEGLVLALPEVDRLYRVEDLGGWLDDGVRAIVRRFEPAVAVRFREGEQPTLEARPLVEQPFVGPPYGLAVEGVPADCVPALEDCGDADLDCDGRPRNGLCCETPGTRWRHSFSPPAGIRRLFIDDAMNRDVYFMALEGDDGVIRAYMVDFTDQNGMVSDEAWAIWDLQERPRPGEPEFDLRGAHDLQGYVQAGAARAVLARDAGGRLSVFWGLPSFGARELFREMVTPLDGCEQILAAGRVWRPLPMPELTVQNVIVVCPDRIWNISPLAEDGEPIQRPLLDPEGRPVTAEWATTTRLDIETLMVVVAWRAPDGTLALTAYLVSPEPLAGAADGILSPNLAADGALGSIPSDERAWPILWSLDNAAYVQLAAADNARARVRRGAAWGWTDLLFPAPVERLELADLNRQIVAGGPGPEGYGFSVASVGGPGGTSLWALRPSVTLPGIESAYWHVSRGASNDSASIHSNGRRYPGIVAVYPEPLAAGAFAIELAGVECSEP